MELSYFQNSILPINPVVMRLNPALLESCKEFVLETECKKEIKLVNKYSYKKQMNEYINKIPA